MKTKRSAEHYADGVLVKGRDLFFVAGQVAVDDDGVSIQGDVVEQTHQVLSNLSDVLAQVGGELADVVKTTVYLLDPEHAAAVAQVRRGAFGHPGPASTLLYVERLARPEFLVEIEAIAAVKAD